MDHRTPIRAALALCAVLTAGCADLPPAEGLQASHAAVAHAEDAGAAQFAPRDLALAHEKLRLGERWIAAGDYKPARWLLEQARVDAELAALRAVAARARRAPAASSQ
jgi:hypothetical protein